MPLRVPNLDDRTFDDLVDEALAMLPRYAPAWTNHNPSDPGITLIELFAYFTELFIYRLNRVTKETKIRFLQLLYGSEPDAKARFAQASSAEVDEALRQAVHRLRRPQRAVTREDYEYLAREATAEDPDMEKVLRARSFVRRNLAASDEAARDADAPGHVSVVVLPARELEQDRLNGLLAEVRNYLEPKRILTTRLHVTQPFFLWITIGAKIHIRPDAPETFGPRREIGRWKSCGNILIRGWAAVRSGTDGRLVARCICRRFTRRWSKWKASITSTTCMWFAFRPEPSPRMTGPTSEFKLDDRSWM